jgi:oxygen-independent coproporphyrinogen-3 oxidase
VSAASPSHEPAGEGTLPAFREPPPLSLYVHLPWCASKCPYCDFNSHPARGEPDFEGYVDALLLDLEAELPSMWGRSVRSVFIGGGTPSLFPPRAIGRLLDGIAARVRLVPGAEITLEANPDSGQGLRLREFVAAGVNRLSVGVQSFDDRLLAAIGRVHDGDAARAAVHAALASGALRVNVDLMFALPGQSRAQVCADVTTALELGVRHVSFYQLTLEPGTAFHRRPPRLPGHDPAMQDAGVALLAGAGLERYEVSAFAAPEQRCAHNLNYWCFGDYLGLGAGAHGKITLCAQGSVVRSEKLRAPGRYVARAAEGGATAARRAVPPAELPFEFMLNALRLTGGFRESLFQERTGLATAQIGPVVDAAVAHGLLCRAGGRIAPTALGRRFLDDLVARFLPV